MLESGSISRIDFLHQKPLKIRSPLPVQRKKYFSPRVIIVVAGFKNNSKEHNVFSRNSSISFATKRTTK